LALVLRVRLRSARSRIRLPEASSPHEEGRALAKRTTRRRSTPARSRKQVYFFGAGRAEGRGNDRETLGGKGAGLAEMTRLGVPVPAGFTISTAVCAAFQRTGSLPRSLRQEVLGALARVEKVMGGHFGDRHGPLLVSVRSGARASMPGMMDTVLNLGINDDTVEGLAEQSGDRRFAFDTYRRFVQMYGDVVLGVDHERFEIALDMRKQRSGARSDTDLDAGELAELVKEYKALVRLATRREFPDDPLDQLWGAIAAVFRSWNTPRAVTYRRLENIPDDWGTAVNVQAMVFGNLGDDSATGVAFTRDPATGERRFFGEYLSKAQGEDVVAGIRTPLPLAQVDGDGGQSLEAVQPACYRELSRLGQKLERHYRDMQDLEFTIQNGRLWMLQTRNGKRTARAAVKIAVDMVRERLIDRASAVLRVKPEQLDQLLHRTLDVEQAPEPVGKGLAASPGAACGQVVFSAEAAEKQAKAGRDVILVRRETSPEDIHGMHAARGILTALGGMTSHAAVVARGMGKCCVSGCSALEIDGASARLGDFEFREGDVLTLDGSSGLIYSGSVPTMAPQLGSDFRELMKWADGFRRLQVRANADTPADATGAREFGAEGIGLCRTEHMFFPAERIRAVRRMILANTPEQRAEALAEILPMQREDFVGIFQAMDGLPVTVRLLDPPLHEFLPREGEDLAPLAETLDVPIDELERKIASLHEFNPMLGLRGCRLGIRYPEIYEVQVRAIFEAACECAERGVRARPEVMIPLVSEAREFEVLRELIDRTAQAVLRERKRKLSYTVGTMVEVPRAALNAGQIARSADFFSFGTNDLTQTTLALSRDDAGRFIPFYVERGIFPDDPFVTLDIDGVGRLIQLAVQDGRKVRKKLKIGICGEHGGDPRSVAFCVASGLDYVSCSPFRVPVARLAAAHAALAK
jgi:pyruvate, orthophosphate dikinase